MKKKEVRDAQIKKQIRHGIAEQQRRMQNICDQKIQEHEKKIKERLEAKQLIEAENKEDQTRIRCWCERQLTSYTDEDLKSATQKLDGLALRVTDDNLVLLRKRLVGLEQQLEPEEFGDLIHDTFALRLSKAERSALGTGATFLR